MAFAGRNVPIVRDARLRECDYGTLTRRPASEIEARRLQHVDIPFPGGESYAQVASRVAAWVDEVVAAHPDRQVLVIGHRATFYAFEHLLRGAPLAEAVRAPWRWQPGWLYTVRSGRI
jgi:probable phosphoglycerate mutase